MELSKIEFKNVSFNYQQGAQHANTLENISFEIEQGEFICILGPSGCGKSTLISLLSGLRFPTDGEIYIDGETVTGPGTNRGMVFQHYSLFPWLTAKNNIVFGIREAGILKGRRSKIRERAMYFLSQVGLLESADKYPFELSGGMQQRVALARALAMDTDILLMDEPFGAIDPQKRAELQELSIQLCKNGSEKKTVVFITHDIDEALFLADKVYFMEPKHIRSVIPVDFPSDLTREEIIRLPEYNALRKRCQDLFSEISRQQRKEHEADAFENIA